MFLKRNSQNRKIKDNYILEVHLCQCNKDFPKKFLIIWVKSSNMMCVSTEWSASQLKLLYQTVNKNVGHLSFALINQSLIHLCWCLLFTPFENVRNCSFFGCFQAVFSVQRGNIGVKLVNSFNIICPMLKGLNNLKENLFT